MGGLDADEGTAGGTNFGARWFVAGIENAASRIAPTIQADLPAIGKRQWSSLRTRTRRSYNTEVGEDVWAAALAGVRHMDKFEEIGQKLDKELTRLRKYVEEEVAPGTEKRTARFLREVSELLTDAAGKLEARNAARETAAGAGKDAHS
jgi:hypothetical protein